MVGLLSMGPNQSSFCNAYKKRRNIHIVYVLFAVAEMSPISCKVKHKYHQKQTNRACSSIKETKNIHCQCVQTVYGSIHTEYQK